MNTEEKLVKLKNCGKISNLQILENTFKNPLGDSYTTYTGVVRLYQSPDQWYLCMDNTKIEDVYFFIDNSPNLPIYHTDSYDECLERLICATYDKISDMYNSSEQITHKII